MTSTVIYSGNLRTNATHFKSGTQIETDAPLDNKGKGEKFSPTDLVATALASCMLTIMGIKARDHNINIEGTACEIQKIMESNPRRIGEIKIDMTLHGQDSYSDKEKAILENAALTCPVFKSLNDNLIKTVIFNW